MLALPQRLPGTPARIRVHGNEKPRGRRHQEPSLPIPSATVANCTSCCVGWDRQESVGASLARESSGIPLSTINVLCLRTPVTFDSGPSTREGRGGHGLFGEACTVVRAGSGRVCRFLEKIT